MSPLKESRVETLGNFVRANAELFKQRNWTEFTKTVNVPPAFAIALATGRAELIRVVEVHELTHDETKALYDLVATLIETNFALQQHAQIVAREVSMWSGIFKPLARIGEQINHFANYRAPDEEDPHA